MSAVAVLGTGRVGRNLAEALARAGHTTTVHSLRSGSLDLSSVEIVVNALPGEVCVEALRPLAAELRGKVLIDVANATRRGPDGLPAELVHPGGSLAEELQRALPGTRVVKTLNTMLYTVMTAPGSLGGPVTAFLSGDDDAAKLAVRELLADLGWPADWVLDLGGIGTARVPEVLVLLTGPVFRVNGPVPFGLAVTTRPRPGRDDRGPAARA